MEKRKRSIFPIILGVAMLFLACFAVSVWLVGIFAVNNFALIKDEADQAMSQVNVAHILASSGYKPQSKIRLGELIEPSLPKDTITATLGESVVVGDVYFEVSPSRAVVRDPNAAASVDVSIINNSHEAIVLPMETAWSAFCPEGTALEYTWDTWNSQYENADGSWEESNDLTAMEKQGVIAPGSAYQVTLMFHGYDGEVADALIVLTEFNEILDDVARIFWCFEAGESNIY
ncbi:MAG: hypothetical protein FWC86_01680 [Coriobacteriia bacterium]|nr:hypothetical protein [Coriobacteriia bacterium]